MRRVLLITLLLITGFCIGIAYATSFSETYDIATPAGSDDPAEADDRMREIKAAVQERLNVEHVFDLTGTEVSHADTGKHTDITCDSIVNAGTLAAGNTTITGTATISSTLDVAGNIDPTTYETTNGGFLDEDDLASDANDKVASQQSIKKYVDDQQDPAYSGGQSHTFNGGLIMKMGYTTIGAYSGTVTFGTAFPTGIVSVELTLLYNGATAHKIHLRSISKANFGWQAGATDLTGFYWIAIGH